MKTISEIIGQRERYCVNPAQTVRQAVDYLCEKGAGAVAVCDCEEVVGVFSERDLMRRVVAEGRDPDSTYVSDVMSEDIVCVGCDESCDVAQALMLAKKLRHLIVVDQGNRFQGFVSMRELLVVDLAASKELIAKLNDDYYDHQFKKLKR